MLAFPISQSDAAEALKISAAEASILVRGIGIPTVGSPQNAKAKMLDADGFRRLEVAAAKLRVLDTIQARQPIAV